MLETQKIAGGAMTRAFLSQSAVHLPSHSAFIRAEVLPGLGQILLEAYRDQIKLDSKEAASLMRYLDQVLSGDPARFTPVANMRLSDIEHELVFELLEDCEVLALRESNTLERRSGALFLDRRDALFLRNWLDEILP